MTHENYDRELGVYLGYSEPTDSIFYDIEPPNRSGGDSYSEGTCGVATCAICRERKLFNPFDFIQKPEDLLGSGFSDQVLDYDGPSMIIFGDFENKLLDPFVFTAEDRVGSETNGLENMDDNDSSEPCLHCDHVDTHIQDGDILESDHEDLDFRYAGTVIEDATRGIYLLDFIDGNNGWFGWGDDKPSYPAFPARVVRAMYDPENEDPESYDYDDNSSISYEAIDYLAFLGGETLSAKYATPSYKDHEPWDWDLDDLETTVESIINFRSYPSSNFEDEAEGYCEDQFDSGENSEHSARVFKNGDVLKYENPALDFHYVGTVVEDLAREHYVLGFSDDSNNTEWYDLVGLIPGEPIFPIRLVEIRSSRS